MAEIPGVLVRLALLLLKGAPQTRSLRTFPFAAPGVATKDIASETLSAVPPSVRISTTVTEHVAHLVLYYRSWDTKCTPTNIQPGPAFLRMTDAVIVTFIGHCSPLKSQEGLTQPTKCRYH